MIRKKIAELAFSLFFVLALIISVQPQPVTAVESTTNYEVTIDGKPVMFNDSMGRPWLSSLNRTMVPIRIISENMGYNVTWDQATKTAVIKNGTDTLEVTIGKNTAIKNGKVINVDIQDGKPVDTKAELIDSRTYVPIRFISEAMGATVGYNRVQSGNIVIHQITITTGKIIPPVGTDPTFNPATDVLPDGRLSKEKTTEYIEEMIGGTVLKKVGNDYYLEFERPAIAEGYKTVVAFDSLLTAGGGYTLKSEGAPLAKNALPSNQSFSIKLDPAKLINVKYYKFTLTVATNDGRGSTKYEIWYYPSKNSSEYLYTDEWGTIIEYREFDKNRLFEGL